MLIQIQRNLEHLLIPAIHSMALLNKEIESEEHALTEEMTILDDLRKNLKIEESLRKQQKTKVDTSIPADKFIARLN